MALDGLYSSIGVYYAYLHRWLKLAKGGIGVGIYFPAKVTVQVDGGSGLDF